MNEEIDNDPDFEENSIDPFNSDESEIDDSDHENDPPLDRIVAHIFYWNRRHLFLTVIIVFSQNINILKTFQRKYIFVMDKSRK